MGAWSPIEQEELEQIIREDSAACTPEQRAVFERYRVPLRKAPIERYGKLEHVFVVAQRGEEVMYFEDIDEGVNFSPIDAEGKILQHWCNQDELVYALWHWMGRCPKIGVSCQRTELASLDGAMRRFEPSSKASTNSGPYWRKSWRP